jgi:murein tripeptide amidase MpaA
LLFSAAIIRRRLRILKHDKADAFFSKYRLLVLPLINPDGVDLGHWRHNAQGVDLNRDYAEYQQPEIKALTDFLVNTASENEAKVLIGLDFHSTYEDVYYTSHETDGVEMAGFKDEWLNAIQKGMKPYDYRLKEEKHSVTSNASAQHWFYHQFRALGITYEIGDNTERGFIKVKAKVSADALADLLNKE